MIFSMKEQEWGWRLGDWETRRPGDWGKLKLTLLNYQLNH